MTIDKTATVRISSPYLMNSVLLFLLAISNITPAKAAYAVALGTPLYHIKK